MPEYAIESYFKLHQTQTRSVLIRAAQQINMTSHSVLMGAAHSKT